MKIKIGDALVLDITRILEYLEKEYSTEERTRHDFFTENISSLFKEAVVSLNPATDERVRNLEQSLSEIKDTIEVLLSK